MYISRASARNLRHRLDPDHYSPDATRLDQILSEMGNAVPLKKLVNPLRSITNGVRGPDLQSSCFKLVRLQDCKDWEVVYDECLTISQEQFVENRRCRLLVGDIVVAIGGYLGNAAIVSKEDRAVIGQHSALLPFDHETQNKPRYIVAYLNSKYGEVQFSRWSRGIVQAGLNLEDVAEIEIPMPDHEVQSYISDKVYQAEQLRSLIVSQQTVLRTIEDSLGLSQALPLLDDESKPNWRVSANYFSPERGDAKFYRPVYRNLEQRLLKSVHGSVMLGDICDRIRYGSSVPADYVHPGQGIQFIRGSDLLRNVIPTWNLIDIDSKHSNSIGNNRLRAGQVIITRSGTVGIAAPVVGRAVGAAYGSFMMSLSLVDGWEPEFVSWAINAWAGQKQVERLENGSVQLNINIGELSSIQIPRVDRAQQKMIASLVAQVTATMHAAHSLCVAARLLVEALIEGKVTEVDLIAAHKDAGADRALLSRLTVDGLDIQGAVPLFHDIDRLPALLAASQNSEES